MTTHGEYIDAWIGDLLEARRVDEASPNFELLVTPAYMYDPRLAADYIPPEPLKVVRPNPLEQFKYLELGSLAAMATCWSPLIVYA